jgi:hypothetical protein
MVHYLAIPFHWRCRRCGCIEIGQQQQQQQLDSRVNNNVFGQSVCWEWMMQSKRVVAAIDDNGWAITNRPSWHAVDALHRWKC